MHSLFWSSPLGRVVIGLGVFTLAFWALAAAAFLTWSPSQGVAVAAASRHTSHVVKAREAIAAPDTQKDSCADKCDDASGSSYSYDYTSGANDSDDFAWAVLDGSGSMTIDGGDVGEVRGHARHGQALFWFRDGDEEFFVSDRAIVDEARRATTRVRELGSEMGRIGAEMGRHGAAMGRLGGRMGSIGARVAMAEARLAADPEISNAERDRQREQLNDLQQQLQVLQRRLDTQQGEHERSQRELSRRMSELSAQHQAALAEARARLRELSLRARREGKAERPHANA